MGESQTASACTPKNWCYGILWFFIMAFIAFTMLSPTWNVANREKCSSDERNDIKHTGTATNLFGSTMGFEALNYAYTACNGDMMLGLGDDNSTMADLIAQLGSDTHSLSVPKGDPVKDNKRWSYGLYGACVDKNGVRVCNEIKWEDEVFEQLIDPQSTYVFHTIRILYILSLAQAGLALLLLFSKSCNRCFPSCLIGCFFTLASAIIIWGVVFGSQKFKLKDVDEEIQWSDYWEFGVGYWMAVGATGGNLIFGIFIIFVPPDPLYLRHNSNSRHSTTVIIHEHSVSMPPIEPGGQVQFIDPAYDPDISGLYNDNMRPPKPPAGEPRVYEGYMDGDGYHSPRIAQGVGGGGGYAQQNQSTYRSQNISHKRNYA